MLVIQTISRMILWYAICLNGYITGFIARKISEWLKKNGPEWINENIRDFLAGIFLGSINSIWLIILSNQFFIIIWLTSGLVGFSAIFLAFSTLGWMNDLLKKYENNTDIDV